MKTAYYAIILFLLASGIFIWAALYFVAAGYGRYANKKWGPAINPKWGWMIMESPALFLPIILACFGKIQIVTAVMAAIWLIHYIHRTLIYPFLIRSGSKTPLSIILMSLCFNVMNGFTNGYQLFFLSDYKIEWFYDPRFIAGVLIFFCGIFINISSDHIIRVLRREKGAGYHIADKGLHKFVASPNYFGEVLEWTGWAILTWSAAGLTFMFFTMANLVPRAHKHREWYKKHFGDKYPSSRKRIFPFIY